MIYKEQTDTKIVKGAPISGIVKFPAGSGQVAIKFIEPGKNFNEALTNTRITDENFLRNIVLLASKMERFNDISKGSNGAKIFDNDINSLTNLLNGMRSINGIGMNLAAMTESKIYYPQGGGMPAMGREDMKAVKDINRIKRSQRNRQIEDDDID